MDSALTTKSNALVSVIHCEYNCTWTSQTSVASENFFGVFRDFGQRTWENWCSVQGYDSNKLAGDCVLLIS